MPYDPPASIDHVPRGLARFLEQFKSKPKLQALATVYLNRIQELENACWEVILFRLLSNAEGAQLDTIGRVVGRGRNNLSDTDYKIAISAQIRINRSCGTPEDLIDVTRLTVPSGFTFTYDEAYPKTVLITVIGGVDWTISVLYDNLFRAKSSAVKLFLQYSLADDANTFTFASGDSLEVSAAQGFGDDSNPSIGGRFSDIF